MRLNEDSSTPFMKSLVTCLNRMVKEGYTEDFKITKRGLQPFHKPDYYGPEQIQEVNFFRFEGQSDPDDNAILYVIETNDGIKGTLVDAFGIYHDPEVSKFMKDVEMIKRINPKN